MIIDNRYYRIKSIFGYWLRALHITQKCDLKMSYPKEFLLVSWDPIEHCFLVKLLVITMSDGQLLFIRISDTRLAAKGSIKVWNNRHFPYCLPREQNDLLPVLDPGQIESPFEVVLRTSIFWWACITFQWGHLFPKLRECIKASLPALFNHFVDILNVGICFCVCFVFPCLYNFNNNRRIEALELLFHFVLCLGKIFLLFLIAVYPTSGFFPATVHRAVSNALGFIAGIWQQRPVNHLLPWPCWNWAMLLADETSTVLELKQICCQWGSIDKFWASTISRKNLPTIVLAGKICMPALTSLVLIEL